VKGVPWQYSYIRIAHQPGCPRREPGQIAVLGTLSGRTGIPLNALPAMTTSPRTKPLRVRLSPPMKRRLLVAALAQREQGRNIIHLAPYRAALAVT
jgi:hypothetical protein